MCNSQHKKKNGSKSRGEFEPFGAISATVALVIAKIKLVNLLQNLLVLGNCSERNFCKKDKKARCATFHG
jgi:hypothetical protein